MLPYAYCHALTMTCDAVTLTGLEDRPNLFIVLPAGKICTMVGIGHWVGVSNRIDYAILWQTWHVTALDMNTSIFWSLLALDVFLIRTSLAIHAFASSEHDANRV